MEGFKESGGKDLAFSAVDYALFILMMLLSVLIGVYYGCYRKQDSVSEYLLGGQQMGSIPMAMSLLASSISGIAMMAVPADLYMFGTQYFVVGLTVFPAIAMIQYWFVPMFHKLQFTSSFEYLEHRFSRGVRHFASLINTVGSSGSNLPPSDINFFAMPVSFDISFSNVSGLTYPHLRQIFTFQLLNLPVVVYVPCLALNQASGISVHIISPISCIVCIFYTSLGGLKAVVWTDVLQLILLALASLVVLVLGVLRVGGLDVVWERAHEGGRLILLDLDPSLYARCSLWGAALGSLVMHLTQFGSAPCAVQRTLCVPSLRSARRMLSFMALCYFATKILSAGMALVMFAAYHRCDPLAAGAVRKLDQLVPYYVMDVAADWPGLPGLFMAGVFSAALSTMSSVLNTLSGTLYKDFVEKLLPRQVSEKRASSYMKLISIAIGAFTVVMIFVIENLGGALQVSLALGGVTGGAAFGLYALGMFFPWANSKGAYAGSIGSMIIMAAVVGGNSYAQATNKLYYPSLPTRVDGCASNTTLLALQHLVSSTTPATLISAAPPVRMPHDADVFFLFKISFFYYGFVGTVVTLALGLGVSLCTGPLRPGDKHPDLFSPLVARFLPGRKEDTQYGAVPWEDKLCLQGPVTPTESHTL